MSYTNVYPSRINWENEPSIASPINATNLNKIDYAVYEHDQTFETWDVTKANQSDLLLSVKSIDYDTTTGVFVFTWQNGTTKTVDLNIEKIPVSFSMSAQGVITMTTEDGTQYTADVGSLIKTYTFDDSTEIDFTVTTDQSGNKTVTATIKDGSIVGTKLEPNYLANCQSAANSASGSATAAEGSSEDSEAWAVGTRDGVPVPSSDPAYNNNSKYWALHTSASLAGLTDTDITSPTNGQVLTYDGSKWINDDPSAGGGSKVVVSTAEASLIGTTCTLAQGGDSYTATFDSNGVATFEGVTLTGTVTITATDGQSTATRTLEIPYFGNYTQTISFFSATITATFTADKGATCTCDGVTASTSPYTFTVGAAGTYSIVCTLDGVNKSVSVPISTDGQTESVNFAFGTINLTYDNEFRGLSLTCSQTGGSTITKTAPSGANSMSFYPDATGTWEITGTYSGQSYSTGEITVSSLSTAVSANLQTYIVATVTLHGAVGATISYVDVTGLQTKALDENGECANVVVKVDPSNPYVSFVDTNKSKLPEDLTKSYFKRVEITNALTDIYITPDNALYWWGYKNGIQTCNTTNGWSISSASWSYTDPTYNTNNISLSTSTNQYCYIGSTSAINCLKTKTIATGVRLNQSSSPKYGYTLFSNKDLYASQTDVQIVNSSSMTYYEKSVSANDMYMASGTDNNGSMTLHALWYDTTTPTTPTYYSAAYDMLYIKDTSNNIIPIAVTDAEGKAYDALLPNGTYTIYSSVAKNPDSLSDAYSKTVTITNATSDVYVMPNNALYWWGYMSSNCEELSTANGWVAPTNYTFTPPTYNTNDILMTGTGTKISGVANKNPISFTKLICIGSGITMAGNVSAELLALGTTKSRASAVGGDWIGSSSNIEKAEQAYTLSNGYMAWDTLGARSYRGYALWYE